MPTNDICRATMVRLRALMKSPVHDRKQNAERDQDDERRSFLVAEDAPTTGTPATPRPSGSPRLADRSGVSAG